MIWVTVQLVDIKVYTEVTTAWSPVTYAHLNFYVNGLLSMPGSTEGLTNIFEVNEITLQYDQEAFLADIAEYGLLDYADFDGIIPAEIFDAFQLKYINISIAKGLITWERVEQLIAKFSVYWS